MVFPVHSVTIPTSLGGQSNGRLSSSLLVRPGFPGRPAGTLHQLASNAWLAMAREVQAHFGETLTVTSTGDAYRTYSQQEATFRNRYTTTRLPGRPTKQWMGQTWYQKPGTAMAGVPGTSNHGWGLATDTCIWRNNQVLGITANMPMFNWLLLNAFRFGLSWEAQSEPWHLRYYTGDRVPPAVGGGAPEPTPPTPTPPTPTGDDEVLIQFARSNGEVFAVYSNGTKIWQPNDGTLARAKDLAALGGKDNTVHDYPDLTLFAALGQVIGLIPAGHDNWGNHV